MAKDTRYPFALQSIKFKPLNKMTHEEKVTYMATALNICKYAFNKMQADLFVSLYDLILQKEGQTDLESISKVVADHEERFKLINQINPQP